MKSPKEEIVESKIIKTVDEIVSKHIGGDINKLFRLVPKKQRLKERITVAQLEKLYKNLSAITLEQRMREYDLRADRADVIVPAAHIFLCIADAVSATDIIVPTIGLSDGIINELAVKLMD